MTKKIAIFFSNSIFRILLFFSISLFALLFLLTNESYISMVLEENNAYSRFIPALLESNSNQPITGSDSIKLSDPTITELFSSVFPETYIRTTTEDILRSTYLWLNGTTSELNLVIDLRDREALLSEGLADLAIERVENLPECEEFTTTELDPFSATCRPQFIDLTNQRDELVTLFQNNPGLLGNPVIDASEFIDQDNATVLQLPLYYSLAKNLWIVLLILLSLIAYVIIRLSPTRKIGLRRLAYSLLGAAVSLTFFTAFFSFIVPLFTGSLPILQTDSGGIDGLMNDITLSMGRDIALMTIYICIPLVVLGIVLLAISKPKRSDRYKKIEKKSGMASSIKKKPGTKNLRKRPPLQSSEATEAKRNTKQKSKKYRTIPKKEI